MISIDLFVSFEAMGGGKQDCLDILYFYWSAFCP